MNRGAAIEMKKRDTRRRGVVAKELVREALTSIP